VIAHQPAGLYADVFWLVGAGLAFVLPCLVALLVFLSAEFSVRGSGLGLGIFAIIFCLAGGAMLAGGLVRLWHAFASQYWPVTDGVVVYQQQEASTSATRYDDGTTERSTSYGTSLGQTGTVHSFANSRRTPSALSAAENGE